jgi:phosphate transport system protein
MEVVPGSEAEHGVARRTFDRRLARLRLRLTEEAGEAVAMLESALDALWRLDHAKAAEVRRGDDRIDTEEVQIEEECFRILTLEQPVARDFRVITFILKVNADIERVADHACSIAKIVLRLDPLVPPVLPTTLRELGERVPVMCHDLLRAVLDEDAVAAKRLIDADDVIDRLERRSFDEIVDLMNRVADSARTGLLLSRVARDLERVGDLMVNVAEDLVYLVTGEIIRHEGKTGGRSEHAGGN